MSGGTLAPTSCLYDQVLAFLFIIFENFYVGHLANSSVFEELSRSPFYKLKLTWNVQHLYRVVIIHLSSEIFNLDRNDILFTEQYSPN